MQEPEWPATPTRLFAQSLAEGSHIKTQNKTQILANKSADYEKHISNYRYTEDFSFWFKFSIFMLLLGVVAFSFEDVEMIAIGRAHGYLHFAKFKIDSVDEVSAGFILLCLFVHDALEVTIGYGTGSEWASDYIIVILGTWIYLSASEWGRLSRENRQEETRRKQEKDAKRWWKENEVSVFIDPSENDENNAASVT